VRLCLSEEQELIAQSVRTYFARESPVGRMRQIRDGRDATGFSRPLWKAMAGLGWPGMAVSEQFGGSGFGSSELGIIAEQCGRSLAPEPFFSTALLGASAISVGASQAQQTAILPALARGELILSLAWQESARFHPTRIATTAVSDGSGFRLHGEKRFVPDAHVADQLVVVARTMGDPDAPTGLTVFLVDARAPGVSITRTSQIDGRNSGIVRLTDVSTGGDSILGALHGGAEVLDHLLDRGSAFLASELVGISLEAFDRTLRYLKDREQFGVRIGSFQALQHRAARLFCECEMAVSVARAAHWALDHQSSDRSLIASAAKAKCCEVAAQVTNESIQMHGGIGMTDDHDIGLYLKRARVISSMLGDQYFHRARFAALSGF